jgi:hypothetical protein
VSNLHPLKRCDVCGTHYHAKHEPRHLASASHRVSQGEHELRQAGYVAVGSGSAAWIALTGTGLLRFHFGTHWAPAWTVEVCKVVIGVQANDWIVRSLDTKLDAGIQTAREYLALGEHHGRVQRLLVARALRGERD